MKLLEVVDILRPRCTRDASLIRPFPIDIFDPPSPDPRTHRRPHCSRHWRESTADDDGAVCCGASACEGCAGRREGLGVIVELVESTLGSGSLVNASTAEKEEMIRSLEPFVERGNSYTDAHGKISTNPLNMIIVTSSSTKPLIRMDKGSLARKANYAAFEEEIQGCYDSQGAEEETAAILREQTSSFLRQGMSWTFSRLGWIVYRLRGCGFYCRVRSDCSMVHCQLRLCLRSGSSKSSGSCEWVRF